MGNRSIGLTSGRKEASVTAELDVTLRRLLVAAALTNLSLVSAPHTAETSVRNVVLNDPAQPLRIRRGDLVLGVGLNLDESLPALLRKLGDQGAAALVVKADARHSVREPVGSDIGAALVRAPSSASWLDLAILLRELILSLSNHPKSQEAPVGDLFDVANSVAAATGAPVIIEDLARQVLAYSKHSSSVDGVRLESIVGRQVPRRAGNPSVDGTYRILYQSLGPVFFEPIEAVREGRLAMALRVGGETVGSVWALTPHVPGDVVKDAFAQAVNRAAVDVLRHRMEADWARRTRIDLVEHLIQGRAGSQESAELLGLRPGHTRVLAVSTRVEPGPLTPVMARLWESLEMHTSVLPGRPPSALIGGTVYVLLPVTDDSVASRTHLAATAAALASTVGLNVPDVIVGIGSAVEVLRELPRSREEADAVVNTLRAFPALPRIADVDSVRLEAFLLRALSVEIPADAATLGPLAVLAGHDAMHGTAFVSSLGAFLDSLGDIAIAARTVGVHVNTLRYRLKRLQAISGVRLSDPDQRLAVMLQLRYWKQNGLGWPSKSSSPSRSNKRRTG